MLNLIGKFFITLFLIVGMIKCYAASPELISEQQVTKDMNYLASDKLKGRQVFTTEIDLAADYIAQRFSEIGLSPMQGLDNFKQSFDIFNITPDQLSLKLNSTDVAEEHVMVVTSHETLQWKNLTDFKLRFVGVDDDFAKVMQEVNRKEEDIVLIVTPSHADIFARYKNHFKRGLSKFHKNKGPSAVVVISEQTDISKFNLNAKSKVKTQRLTNVVGVLPSVKKTDDAIIYSAHYDHLGVDKNLVDDQIFNGADDDASGTTAVINLASYFAHKKSNQRNLMFVAFTAEEIGGFGSKYFSKQINPNHIKAMINIEMIGKPSVFGAGNLWMTGFERSDLASLMNSSLESSGMKQQSIQSDPYPQQQLFYRSDNATLARLGVPAHSFSSSQIDKDQHYHQVSDQVESLDLASMTQVIRHIAIASESIVDGSTTPTRVDIESVIQSGFIY